MPDKIQMRLHFENPVFTGPKSPPKAKYLTFYSKVPTSIEKVFVVFLYCIACKLSCVLLLSTETIITFRAALS